MTAWITAKITSQRELIGSYREKRGEEYDEATGEMQYCECMDCDPDEIDSLYDEEKRKMMPAPREAKESVEPVLDASRKSELGFTECLIGKFL